MSEDKAVSVVDRSTTSFGLEVLRVRSGSDDHTTILESFGLSANMKGRLALERAREVEKRAKLVSQISNPTLLKLHGVRRLDGKHYVEREDVPGSAYLVDYLKGNTVSPKTAVKWVLVLAELCRDYEKSGLSIKGLSDRNILVTPNGEIRVIDPGVSLILQEFRGDCEDPDNFLAPESIYDDSWASASDMFVLGVLMYEMLTGVKPFDDPAPENIVENVMQKKHSDPRYLNPDISQEIVRVVDRLLQKSPGDRFDSLNSLCSELRSIIDQSAYRATPREREVFERGKRRMEASNKAWQARRWFNRNKTAVLVVGVVILAVIAIQLLTPETPPIITADMTAQEVVQAYYEALAESDVLALEEILAKDVEGRNGIINRASTIHVVLKMQETQRLAVPVAGMGGLEREIPRPYEITDVQIRVLAEPVSSDNGAIAQFETTYTESFIDRDERVYVKKREVIELTRVESLWRITSLESADLEETRVPMPENWTRE